MSVIISDDKLYVYEHRLKDQVVLITGAANGLGKATSKELAKRGAKVVIGDIDVKGAHATVEEIKAAGGEAVCQVCDVLKYESLVSLFQLALSTYGDIDIVYANAGVTEVGTFSSVKLDENGLPTQPSTLTMDVNATGVIFTSHLAYYYLRKNTKRDSLKALVIMGSMASFNPLPATPFYTASKHAVYGFMRALKPEFDVFGLRVVTVCPWFTDTNIVSMKMKALLVGIPMVPIQRVVGTMVFAATDTEPGTTGAAYTLPDHRELLRIPHRELNDGVYEMMGNRVRAVFSTAQSVGRTIRFIIWLLRSPVVKLLLFVVVAGVVYLFVPFRGLGFISPGSLQLVSEK